MIKLNPYKDIEVSNIKFNYKGKSTQNIEHLAELAKLRHSELIRMREQLDRKNILLLSFLLGFVSLTILSIYRSAGGVMSSSQWDVYVSDYIFIIAFIYLFIAIEVVRISFMPKKEIALGAAPKELEHSANLSELQYKINYLTWIQKAIDYNASILKIYAGLFRRSVYLTVLMPIFIAIVLGGILLTVKIFL